MKIKKLLSGIIAVIVVLSVLSSVSITVNAASYDANTALAYAAAHWNDGNGACATFVSNCLSAGGCTAWSSGVGVLRTALINGNWGTEYRLSRNGNYIYQSNNIDKVSPGDPIFFYCTSCKSWEHVEIAGNYSNYVTGYGHNAAKNNTNVATFQDVKGHTGASYIDVYAFHMNSHTHSYERGLEADHPHRVYMKCSCGASYYTGETTKLDGCELCRPLRVVATDETRLTGFTWNNMDNAHSYDLRVWKTADDTNVFTVYGIKNTDYSHTLPAGNYYAELCVGYKNGVIEYFDRVNFTVKSVSSDFQPTNTAIFGNKIYALFENTVSYDYAKTAAEKMGGHLASIHSKEEQRVIETLILNKNAAFWLGGSDNEKEDIWKWEDGSPWNYENWASGEPNNDATYYENEDYLEISAYTGLWNDVPHRYNFNYGFIAEFYVEEIRNSQTDFIRLSRIDTNNNIIPVSKYIYYNKNVPWEIAETYCENMGGHLATITTYEENIAVSYKVNEGVYIIGATDRTNEGVWKWVNGEEFIYSNWNEGEPNDYSQGEDYAAIYASGLWNDIYNLYGNYGFICEIDVDYALGDINGDGTADNKDLTRLFQYLSNWDVEVNEAALDVNGDSSIDNKDLTRLFQYLSNWDVEIY